jgi:hypothetical protein
MVWCEVWDDDGGGSVNAEFEVLPRVGEEINVFADGVTVVRARVKRIVHASLDVHGKDARPSIQIWTENANWT